jgi:hypothetical protein
MAKFSEVIEDIEGIFGTSSWTSKSIQAYPANYSGAYTNEFVKLEVIPSRPLNIFGNLSVQGQVIAQIYVQTGLGTRRIMEIADHLDDVLQAKTLSNGTQTGTSALSFLGVDPDDNSLFRADYSISFKKY